jgi:hypothetical protein
MLQGEGTSVSSQIVQLRICPPAGLDFRQRKKVRKISWWARSNRDGESWRQCWPVKENRMKEGKRISRCQRAAFMVVSMLFAATVVHAQDGAKAKVAIVVTEDGAPCPWAKVVIRLRGEPQSKAQIMLSTDLAGRTSTTLGAGNYRITAVDSIRSRLPALAYFKIEPGQNKTMKIRLVLQYWDCAHVTCEL